MLAGHAIRQGLALRGPWSNTTWLEGPLGRLNDTNGGKSAGVATNWLPEKERVRMKTEEKEKVSFPFIFINECKERTDR